MFKKPKIEDLDHLPKVKDLVLETGRFYFNNYEGILDEHKSRLRGEFLQKKIKELPLDEGCTYQKFMIDGQATLGEVNYNGIKI